MAFGKTPVSFAGLELNDGTNYKSTLPTADSLPDAEVQMSERMGTFPFYVGQKLEPRELQLRVLLQSTTPEQAESLRDTLLQTLNTASETAQQLIVMEPSGTRKFVYATVVSAQRFKSGVDILLNVAEPVWQNYHLTTTGETFTTGTTELITNGGMESDSDWTDWGTPTTNERSSAQAHGGTYSRHIVTDEANEGIQGATFTTVTGQSYRLVGYVYPISGSNYFYPYVRCGDNSGWITGEALTPEAFSYDAWHKFTRYFTETAGGTGAYFSIRTGGVSEFYVDDISIQECVVITNNGNYESLPVIDIKPTGIKGTPTYPYARPVTVYTRHNANLGIYPVELTGGGWNTTVEVGGGKMQADGDDLRVFNHGREIDRWVDGPNTTTTKVWVNLPLPACNQAGGWKSRYAVTDDTSAIVVNTELPLTQESIQGYHWDVPYLRIGTEDIGVEYVGIGVYTSTLELQYTIMARGARGTSKADHNVGDALYLMNNDVWIAYGNASATAPTVDDDYKPIFDLDTSTNASWDYNSFIDVLGWHHNLQITGWKPRAGTWFPVLYEEAVHRANRRRFHNAAAYAQETGEGTVLGIGAMGHYYAHHGYADAWAVENLCTMTQVQHSGYTELDPAYVYWEILAETAHKGTKSLYGVDDDTYGNKTAYGPANHSVPSDTTRIIFRLHHVAFETDGNKTHYGEATDVKLTLVSVRVPYVSFGSEMSVYYLDCTLSNNTTGKSLGITAILQTNETIRVDCEEHSITHLENNQNLYQALDLGEVRKEWMALAPGSNEIQLADDNLGSIQVIFRYRDRWL